MLDETFYLDGISAKSIGIYLQSPIEFSEPVPICESESVPGRNGDLIFDTNAFENRIGTAKCYAMLHERVDMSIRAINRFLLSKRGYRKLETSDDPEHYWMARVENGARIEQRLRTLSPFEISFDCKPQRFVKSGNEPILFNGNGILYNQYGFPALPLITVYGSGDGELTIGEKTIIIRSIPDVIYLDSDTQNAYNEDGNQNIRVNAPEFPVLEDGENAIIMRGGIERLEIVPRWWEL